eukprot:gene8600-10095_t
MNKENICPSLGVRLLVLVVLSVALMVVDARFTLLKPVRSQMSLVLMQTYWITDLPQRLYQGVASQFGSRTELVAENEKLKTENLLLQGRMQKLAALTEQNVRLRELLNSSALVNEKVEVAELIGMDPNPFTHRIIINKGERDGVVLGQPVLDARGLMGQVVELMPYTSRVLLLTDTTHSIPVQVNRNGLRAIASGTGNPERLELRHVADTADIKEGDLLVSSGLGQRFPAGYPVATVKEVIHDSGQPFAIVRAVPTAALNRSRYLLLVFSDNRTPEERANEAAQAQEAEDKQNGTAPIIPATVPKPAAPAAPAAAPATPAAPVATPRASGQACGCNTCRCQTARRRQTTGRGPGNHSAEGRIMAGTHSRNGWIVWLTFAIGLLLSVSPLPQFMEILRPLWLALLLAFWALALPHKVGMVTAMCLGLMEDVLYGTLLGQNALILTLITFLVLSLQQRLRMFPMWQQCLVILVIFGLAQLVQLWLSALTGNRQPTLALVLPALVSALLWPWVSFGLRGLRRRYKIN